MRIIIPAISTLVVSVAIRCVVLLVPKLIKKTTFEIKSVLLSRASQTRVSMAARGRSRLKSYQPMLPSMLR